MVDKKKQLSRVLMLYKLFHEGMIPTLPQHEVNPGLSKGSRENYLYFTLPPSLNFQRSSPAMWAAALRTYQDSETNYVFFPELLVQKTREEIQKSLLKYKLAIQTNKHTDVWITLSKTLHTHFQSDPRELMKSGDWDVTKIHQIIQRDFRKDFPYLSGPKLSNYWLYILSQYTDAQLKNMREISVIPDTHVIQCSIRLGLASRDMGPLDVAAAWKELLLESEISPVEMHPVLWNWSRNNFLPEV